ncbi:MAG: hypothetical protein MZV70_22605 [Desulfobacterales bacterium]|nr:hypothetical protein [Desulfobacterales bacterium]
MAKTWALPAGKRSTPEAIRELKRTWPGSSPPATPVTTAPQSSSTRSATAGTLPRQFTATSREQGRKPLQGQQGVLGEAGPRTSA